MLFCVFKLLYFKYDIFKMCPSLGQHNSIISDGAAGFIDFTQRIVQLRNRRARVILSVVKSIDEGTHAAMRSFFASSCESFATTTVGNYTLIFHALWHYFIRLFCVCRRRCGWWQRAWYTGWLFNRKTPFTGPAYPRETKPLTGIHWKSTRN